MDARYIRNVELYALQDFDHAMLKRELMQRFGRVSEWRNFGNAAVRFVIHALGWLLVALIDRWWFSGLAALFLGLNLVGIFIVFHDAGHRTLSRSRLINDAFGDLAGAVFGFGTSWILARESHKEHHRRNGHVDEVSALWKPMTREDYERASWWSRLPYALKMRQPLLSVLELGNFKRTLGSAFTRVWASKRKRRELLRSQLLSLLINAGMVYAAYLLMGWAGVAWLYLLPNFIGISAGAFFDRLNHANPEMRFSTDETWHNNESDMRTTIRVVYPRLINFLINDMNEHSIHHYVPSIPNRNLSAARRYVDEHYPGLFNEVECSWGYLGEVVRRCQLLRSREEPVFEGIEARAPAEIVG